MKWKRWGTVASARMAQAVYRYRKYKLPWNRWAQLKSKKRHRTMGLGKLKASELIDKLWQQRFRCALSGVELSPENAVPDHKLPISRGGKHRIENIDIVDKTVNHMKGDLTTPEFVGLCKRVAKFWRKKR